VEHAQGSSEQGAKLVDTCAELAVWLFSLAPAGF
jgi:hypothetical protein